MDRAIASLQAIHMEYLRDRCGQFEKQPGRVVEQIKIKPIFLITRVIFYNIFNSTCQKSTWQFKYSQVKVFM